MKIPKFLLRYFVLLIFVFQTNMSVLAASVETVAGHVYAETNDGFLPTVGIALAGDSLETNDGNLYIVDKEQNSVLIVNSSGYKKTFAGTGIAGLQNGPRLEASFNKPHGIIRDSLGNFYISDTGNNLIRKIDASGNVSTFAGSGKNGNEDGVGESASFKSPMGLAIDQNDNIYIADQRNHIIRKISPNAVVTTIAGDPKKSGFDNGYQSSFKYPESVAVDNSGNIYVADKQNHAIRVVHTDGSVETVAGSGKKGNKDGDSKEAQFNNPSDLVLDSSGNIYVADTDNHSIRKINGLGIVSTLVGSEAGFWDASEGSYKSSYFNSSYALSINSNDELLVSDLLNKKIRKIKLNQANPQLQVDTILGSGQAGFNDGKFFTAHITAPEGLAYDKDGNLYFADLNNNFIRRLDKEGNLTTIAGTGAPGFHDGGNPDSEDPATLNKPHSLVINSLGEVYFTDRNNHAIRKIDLTGNIVTIAGSGKQGYKDGTSSEAEFNYPSGLAIDSNDNIFIADTNNHRIRKLDSSGVVTTVSGTKKGYSGGDINFARFDSPSHLVVDNSGNIYVSDQNNHKIRKVSNTGQVTTIAGIGKGYQDGLGKHSQFDTPSGLAITESGLLYVSDHGNNRIRVINLQNSEVRTLVGSGLAGYKDGNDDLVSFKGPSDLIMDTEGNLIVSDTYNHRIRKVKTNITSKSNKSQANKKYYVVTLAGNKSYDLVDGLVHSASFKAPEAVVKDSFGNIFVSDTENHVIRKIDTEGNVSVFAGSGIAGYADGESLKAQFSSPKGLAIDGSDNLYLADYANNRIRKISPNGFVTTIAGSGSKGKKDGLGTEAEFNKPYGIALDSLSNIYVSDSANHTIRKIDSENNVTTFAGSKSGFKDGHRIYSEFNIPEGLAVDSNDNLYVADFGNNRIRKISNNGYVETVAGSGAASFLDGESELAQFNGPKFLGLDEDLNIYVSDSKNNKIRKISNEGIVSTLAGLGTSGSADGLAHKAMFNEPGGLFIDGSSLILCDSQNNTVRQIYKSKVFAKEVLGFASVSEGEGEQETQLSNTRPVLKLATALDYYSKDKHKSIPTYTYGTNLELEVFSYDLEDKDEIQNDITWKSSSQGIVGTGKNFNINDLKLGTHHITVNAKDSGNLNSELSFDLRIIKAEETKTTNNSAREGSNNNPTDSTNLESFIIKITTDENKIFRVNKKSIFNAAAFEISGTETKDLSNQIQWSSSIDGNLGHGSEVKTILSKGTHVITAKIGEHSDSITVEVLNKKKKKIVPKPKSLNQMELPEINLEESKPKNHETKGDKEGSGSDSIGIKDVKIKLL